MKKPSFLLVALALLFSLAACGPAQGMGVIRSITENFTVTMEATK